MPANMHSDDNITKHGSITLTLARNLLSNLTARVSHDFACLQIFCMEILSFGTVMYLDH